MASGQNVATTLDRVLDLFKMCRSNGEWCKIYMEVCQGEEFFTFAVQKPANNLAGTGSTVKKDSKSKLVERS